MDTTAVLGVVAFTQLSGMKVFQLMGLPSADASLLVAAATYSATFVVTAGILGIIHVGFKRCLHAADRRRNTA
jgi:hypothetical protein